MNVLLPFAVDSVPNALVHDTYSIVVWNYEQPFLPPLFITNTAIRNVLLLASWFSVAFSETSLSYRWSVSLPRFSVEKARSTIHCRQMLLFFLARLQRYATHPLSLSLSFPLSFPWFIPSALLQAVERMKRGGPQVGSNQRIGLRRPRRF